MTVITTQTAKTTYDEQEAMPPHSKRLSQAPQEEEEALSQKHNSRETDGWKCVCVCMRERERESRGGGGGGGGKLYQRQSSPRPVCNVHMAPVSVKGTRLSQGHPFPSRAPVSFKGTCLIPAADRKPRGLPHALTSILTQKKS